MLIAQKFLGARTEGATGTVDRVLGGHGGDVLWMKHDDGAEAAYRYTEKEKWDRDAMAGSETLGTERFEGIG